MFIVAVHCAILPGSAARAQRCAHGNDKSKKQSLI